MTTAQKHEYKTTGYNNPWDPAMSITAYFMQLDRFQVSLGNRGIATTKAKKMMATAAQMWQSKMFAEDQMVAWENKTTAQQTWTALQTYFAKKWLERRHYSKMAAKQSRFKEAVLLAIETAGAKEEGESQARCSLQCYRSNTTSRLLQWQPQTLAASAQQLHQNTRTETGTRDNDHQLCRHNNCTKQPRTQTGMRVRASITTKTMDHYHYRTRCSNVCRDW